MFNSKFNIWFKGEDVKWFVVLFSLMFLNKLLNMWFWWFFVLNWNDFYILNEIICKFIYYDLKFFKIYVKKIFKYILYFDWFCGVLFVYYYVYLILLVLLDMLCWIRNLKDWCGFCRILWGRIFVVVFVLECKFWIGCCKLILCFWLYVVGEFF